MNQLRNLLRLNKRKGEFRAEADTNTIYLYDMVVADDFEAEIFGGISPRQFSETLRSLKGTVHLRINSPGGDVFAATAISQAMREYSGEIIAHVDGVAASAASIIAVAADKTVMAPGSLMMIHKAWTMAVGDSDDMMEIASLLEKVDGTLAQAYADKTGGKPEDFAAMMKAETWFTPEEALEAKLADEIAEGKSKAKAAWDLSAFSKAPAAPEAEAQKPEQEIEPDTTEIEARSRRHAVAMLLNAA
jgi:ATP-dependent Clp protease, protease subunit